MKLWINDVGINGYKVVVENENREPVAYKYFGIKGDDQAEAKARAYAAKVNGTVEEHFVVLGNVDELDRELGSLRVSLDAFTEKGFAPVKHELYDFAAKSIYFERDIDTKERVSNYLKAEGFEVLGREDLTGVNNERISKDVNAEDFVAEGKQEIGQIVYTSRVSTNDRDNNRVTSEKHSVFKGFSRNFRIKGSVTEITRGMRRAIQREYGFLGSKFATSSVVGWIESMYLTKDAKRIGAKLPDEVEGQSDKERLYQLIYVFAYQNISHKGLFPLNEQEHEKFNAQVDKELDDFFSICLD